VAQAVTGLRGWRVRFKYSCGLGRQRCVLQKTGPKYLNLRATRKDPEFSTARPLTMVASAAFIVENRMKFLGPDNLYREIRGASLGSVCLVCGEGEGEVKGFLAGVK
jgi:hypothetical protein